jgi:hypothetical protein
MISALVLSFMLVITQGVPLSRQQSGTVRGVLKDSDGKPAAGIRMAAVAKSGELLDALTGTAMSSIAETDAEGRYTLENIPPGRYLIAAGRLDLQTYYPGTPDLGDAREVVVAAGAAISGIDFSMNDLSFGRASQGSALVTPNVDIPIRITVEGGGRLPVSGNGNITGVRLEEAGGRTIQVALNAGSVSVPALPSAYRVTVQNLPETYAVKSITQGSTNLLSGILQLTSSNIPVSLLVTPASLATLLRVPLPTDPVALQAYVAGLAAGRAGLPANGTQVQNGLSVVQRLAAAYTPPSAISIVLAHATPKTTSGVRVSGRTTFVGARTLYLSGIPGNYYSDGTFEVFGVPPGAHVLGTRVNPSGKLALAASLVVGTGDLDGVELQEAVAVPESVWERSEPRASGGRLPGVVPLTRLTGTVLEESSRQPIREGSVILRSGRRAGISFPISPEGRFELPPLFPGSYELEVNVFGHSIVKEAIEVGDTDIKLDLTPRKLY